MTLPDAWTGVVLALATYRVVRLIILDSITQGIREAILLRGGQPDQLRSKRLAELFECPWCMGWWVSLATFAAYEAWPHTVPILSVPFALSAMVGIIGKNLDY